LTKSFGEVRALRGIDLSVPRGTVLGVLGPNGAGKTTAVRILTTLLQPDKGRAIVEGHDVVREAAAVRRSIGLAGQSAAIQEELTGRENLEMIGRLYHLSRPDARSRAAELLAQFDLLDAADRPAKGFSSGMQRRLDLAASLVGRPKVLFLDEPTTGLDPRSRLGMWDIIRSLAAAGTTLLLTTQYLDEADELASEIVVIDHGLVIAAGTAEELKGRVGGDVLEFTVPDRARVSDAVNAITKIGESEPHVDKETGVINVGVGGRGSEALIEAVRGLDSAGVETRGLALRRPSLDDVFLALTGHAAEEDGQPAERRRGRRGGTPMTSHIGGVSPGTSEGAMTITSPRPAIASASGTSMAALGGSSFWPRTRTAITDIQVTLMTPSATSIPIRPMLEPAQHSPKANPDRTLWRQRRRKRCLSGVNS
jgi:ABC-2 type transport system ATP-binding protein